MRFLLTLIASLSALITRKPLHDAPDDNPDGEGWEGFVVLGNGVSVCGGLNHRRGK